MANANLSKIDLIAPKVFQNGERASAEVLNRPIKQIHDNIVNQKNVLDSVVDLLASNNLELDEFQEIVNYIENTRGAIGRISSPLLDLPLKNSLSMKSGVGSVTFSRSTTATYIDRYGVLKTAGIDEPRFEKDGLLIEGKSTNVLTYSQSFNGNNYVGQNGTLEQGKDNIDGSTTAVKFIPSTDKSSHHFTRNAIQLERNKEYTISMIVEKSGNYDYIDIMHGGFTSWETRGFAVFDISNVAVIEVKTDVGAGVLTASITDLGNGRVKCELRGGVREDNDDLSNLNVHAREVSNVKTFTGDGVSGFIIHNIQVEELPFASSYIPTTDIAVTRGEDICLANFSGNHPKIETGTELSIVASYSVLCDVNYSRTRAIVDAGQAIGPGLSLLRVIGGSTVTSYNRNGTGVYTTSHISREITTVATTVLSDDTVSISSDGVLENTENRIPSISVGNYSSKKIGIGCRDSGQIDYLYGHIQGIKIFDIALTPTEVSLLGGN